MQDEETATADLTADGPGLPEDLDTLRPVAQSRQASGRRDLAYLLGAMALVNDFGAGPSERQTCANPDEFNRFAPEPYGRAPGLGPAQTPPMTKQEREERKQARRASAPKRAQRQARKAQRRRK